MRRFFIFLFLFCIPLSVSADIYDAADGVDTQSATEIFGDFDFRDIIDNPKEQKISTIWENVVNIFIKDIKTASKSALAVFLTAVLYSIVSGFEEGAEKTAFLICSVTVAGICCTSFAQIAQLAEGAIKNTSIFMSAAIPCFGVLLAAGGAVNSAGLCAPILVSGTIASYIMSYIGVRALFLSFALSVVGGISERFPLKSLASLLRKSAMWLVCGSQTIFCTIIGAGGFASGSLDAAVQKGVKFAASSGIPVLGGILSDAAEAIAGSSAIIKNTAGAAGILLILAIILYPIIKMAAVIVIYSLSAALCEVVSGKKIGSLLNETADTLKIFIGMMAASGVSSIISLSILIKAGGL